MSKSKSYIFEERDGKLEFVGDFEAYYRDSVDPWGQSATTEMARYYQLSRQRTLDYIKMCPVRGRILEVGCGHGHVIHLLASYFPDAIVAGLDISTTAISQAQQHYPNYRFLAGNIADLELVDKLGQGSFDVVILNQLLWYILDTLPQVQANIASLLGTNGRLVVSNAFAREQRYGIETIDHFDGAVRYFRNSSTFHLLSARFDNDDEEHDDGHFLLALKTKKVIHDNLL